MRSNYLKFVPTASEKLSLFHRRTVGDPCLHRNWPCSKKKKILGYNNTIPHQVEEDASSIFLLPVCPQSVMYMLGNQIDSCNAGNLSTAQIYTTQTLTSEPKKN